MTTLTDPLPAMTTTAPSMSAQELAEQLAHHRVTVIDVREAMEYASGHIAGSLNVPLSRLPQGPQSGLPSWQQAGLPVRKLRCTPCR